MAQRLIPASALLAMRFPPQHHSQYPQSESLDSPWLHAVRLGRDLADAAPLGVPCLAPYLYSCQLPAAHVPIVLLVTTKTGRVSGVVPALATSRSNQIDTEASTSTIVGRKATTMTGSSQGSVATTSHRPARHPATITRPLEKPTCSALSLHARRPNTLPER